MARQGHPTDFFEYLLTHSLENPDSVQLPSLKTISKQLNISVARLREQVEVAKALGLVEVRPRTGIKRLPYSFYPAVWRSLAYAIKFDPNLFEVFANIRKQIELAYWHEAVDALTSTDKHALQQIVDRAYEKLRGTPTRVPHDEHRELHLSIYWRLDNPFVNGIIEAYWDAYEAIGLSFYTHLDYLEEVWDYHQKMVNAIRNSDLETGYKALSDHTDLIRQRTNNSGDSIQK